MTRTKMTQTLMTHTRMTQTVQRISFSFAFVLAMAGLTACAVGPNYKRPAVDVPGMYRGSTADTPVAADAKPQPGQPEHAKAEQVTTSLEWRGRMRAQSRLKPPALRRIEAIWRTWKACAAEQRRRMQ